MSGAKMTKAELQKRLQMLGETPPAGWTKVQLASRLAEISEESETTLSERDAAKMVNKCKTKVALQELLTEHQVYYTKHQNSDQLKSSMLKYLMENKVPASESNYMGFGKHSQLTYGETLVFMPAYVEWCVTTAAEEPECHWRLRRFARWVQGLGEGEKKEITKRIQIEHHGICELENELRQLRDMIQAKTEADQAEEDLQPGTMCQLPFRLNSWPEVVKQVQFGTGLCFAADEDQGESRPPEHSSDDLRDIPADERKRIFQNLRQAMCTAEKVFLEEQAKERFGVRVEENDSSSGLRRPLEQADFLEDCGVVFPEEENGFWASERPAVTFSLELPPVHTKQGKEWTRDLGCFFVKQLKRQAVEVSEKRLSERELEGFRKAKQKEVKNFVVARAFQALPKDLQPSRKQVMKMRWLLTWKLDDDPPPGEPLKRALGVPEKSEMLLTKAAYGLVDRTPIGWVCGHVDDFMFGGAAETRAAADTEDELFALRFQAFEFRGAEKRIDIETLLCQPSSLPCGHTLCRTCLARTLDHAFDAPPACPMCRKDLSSYLTWLNGRALIAGRLGVAAGHGGAQIPDCRCISGSNCVGRFKGNYGRRNHPWAELLTLYLALELLIAMVEPVPKRARFSMEPDVEVELDGGVLQVHSHVLMAASEVFANMLQSGMQEAQSGRIVLKEMALDDFKVVLKHLDLRGGSLPPPITEDNLELLLENADEYQILGLKERCQNFLLKLAKRKPEYVLELSDQYDLESAKLVTARLLTAKKDGVLLNYETDSTVREAVYTELLLSVDTERRNQAKFVEVDFACDDSHEKASRHWSVILRTLAALKAQEKQQDDFYAHGNEWRQHLLKIVRLFLLDFEEAKETQSEGEGLEEEKEINRKIAAIIDRHFPSEVAERAFQIASAETAGGEGGEHPVVPIFICSMAMPSVACPLHIFEPRYRLMMRRFGTMLYIQNFRQLPDGRSQIKTIGARRFQVLEWGEKDGYATGRVRWLEDEAPEPVAAEPATEEAVPSDF
ncbi:LON peptidase N-terminal domain and RING finger protein 1 [Symbiodinium microadriaticum]|uniref:LON peptidase N-terminal domain and RING finger protein 1 n=1 Tax=Symbiodinium microadriaticum TaxID=2951 RepID=A0A1Q9F0I6_SYMMI|nr:LON peptidase N-terminal domain and RING finger protein 1 [Symbiodinium microadriaticum]